MPWERWSGRLKWAMGWKSYRAVRWLLIAALRNHRGLWGLRSCPRNSIVFSYLRLWDVSRAQLKDLRAICGSLTLYDHRLCFDSPVPPLSPRLNCKAHWVLHSCFQSIPNPAQVAEAMMSPPKFQSFKRNCGSRSFQFLPCSWSDPLHQNAILRLPLAHPTTISFRGIYLAR